MNDELKSSERELQKSKKEYDALNSKMSERESAVTQRAQELATERAMVDSIRKNLIATLDQSRLEFIQKSDELHAEVAKWKSSFEQLLTVEAKSTE